MHKKEFRGALIKSKALTLAFASTVYLIWKARHDITFGNKNTIVTVILSQIQHNVYSLLYSLYPMEVVVL